MPTDVHTTRQGSSTDGEWQIRLLQANDVSLARDLLNLFAEAFEEPETYSTNQPSDSYLKDCLKEDRFLLIVAIVDSRVVGGFSAYELQKFEQERHELFIYDLAVQEAFRRRGIATALIEEARNIAAQRGAYLVWIQSETDDEPSSRTYAQFGVPLKASHFELSPRSRKGDG